MRPNHSRVASSPCAASTAYLPCERHLRCRLHDGAPASCSMPGGVQTARPSKWAAAVLTHGEQIQGSG